jgi:hypothetical protein
MRIHGTEQGRCKPATQRHANGHADKADRINWALIELKMKMSDRMGGGGLEAYCLMAINTLMDKLEKLDLDLDSMMSEVRATNPIVGNVLANAAKAMGLDSAAKVMGMPKRDEDDEDDGEVVKDLLMDG